MCEDSELVDRVCSSWLARHLTRFRRAVMHSSLFRNTQDCLTDSNSPFLRGNGCCSARGRKPGLGKSGGVYLCTKYGCQMDTLGFLLWEWHLLTASWTERNVYLDATARPATSPHPHGFYIWTGSESPVVR